MSTDEPPKKVCVYIDGFNLYHAVAEMNDPRLKWLNFRSLAESFLKPKEILEDVYFFTAVLTWDREKQKRHRNFMAAQEAVGVTIVESNFRKTPKFCHVMNQHCKRFEEKQTDVAIATTLMADAIRRRVNRAILVTADSDQVPLVKWLHQLFPEIHVTLSAPPGRGQMARELGNVVDDRVPLKPGRLYAHQLPRTVLKNGATVARMPALYQQQIDGGA
ncbi:NYN domain-containing protein [Sphingomonas sp. MAH-20]|uniref:NYN domain-containing protein n=1 Tax=Sphingomonas horti TaxID=2682842 RepID=A0A6I4J1B8_9SPHN|nr:NYN domain-containing protein [Sphingomonas sp. CGMCC 1.13658]MBA2921082.1 NYN domain-containing protein [Sphingomonas sp. CGMCC 1.13658]MVO78147.1 NYN domain-containing protein [Sphingomonas horti]